MSCAKRDLNPSLRADGLRDNKDSLLRKMGIAVLAGTLGLQEPSCCFPFLPLVFFLSGLAVVETTAPAGTSFCPADTVRIRLRLPTSMFAKAPGGGGSTGALVSNAALLMVVEDF